MSAFNSLITRLLIVFSCGLCMALSPPRKGFKPLTDRVIDRVYQQLRGKYPRLELGATGISAYDGIKGVTMYIGHYGKLNKMEARQLLVEAVTLLVESLNHDEQVSPFLNPRPFTPEHVKVGIVIRRFDGGSILHPEISAVSLRRGEVFFGTVDETDLGYKSKVTEPYSETLRLVRNGLGP